VCDASGAVKMLQTTTLTIVSSKKLNLMVVWGGGG